MWMQICRTLHCAIKRLHLVVTVQDKRTEELVKVHVDLTVNCMVDPFIMLRLSSTRSLTVSTNMSFFARVYLDMAIAWC